MATDIAARGIDVSLISHVINYDIPDTSDAYIHRIGRTGRAARTGDAFTLVTGEDTALVRAIEKVLAAPLERRTLPAFDYSVPAPNKETEFVRPPRQPMQRRKPDTARKTAAVANTSAKPRSAGTKKPVHGERGKSGRV